MWMERLKSLEFWLPISNTQISFKAGTCWSFFLLFVWAITKKHICMLLCKSSVRGCLINNSMLSRRNNYAYILGFYVTLFIFKVVEIAVSTNFWVFLHAWLESFLWLCALRKLLASFHTKRWSVILEHSTF